MVDNGAIIANTTERDRELLSQVIILASQTRDYAGSIPDYHHLIFECHSISRAVAQAIPDLRCVDGNHMGLEQVPRETGLGFELRYAAHSWLVTPDEAIIDLYPVGFLTFIPVLVVTKGDYARFGGNLYIPDKSTTEEVSSDELWRKSQILYGLILLARN